MSISPSSDNLYVYDLPSGIDEEQLRALFSQYGTVKQSRLATGGGALVRYSTVDEATWVVENLHGCVPHGLQNPISVKYAAAPKPQSGQSSGKGGDRWGKGAFNMWNNAYGGLGALLNSKGFGKGKGPFWLPGQKDAKSLVRDLVSGGQLPGGRRWENDENTVFVGGLPEDMTDLHMYTIFATFGAIAPRGASARCDKETGKCTGIGFVNYLEAASASAAIRTLHGAIMADGSHLTVKKKGPPKPKGEGKGVEKSAGAPAANEVTPHTRLSA